jgi:ABC-type dipeptide/oligopeptide/nickel transport system permease subunit
MDRILPVFVILLILAAGSSGNTVVLIVSLSIVTAILTVGQVSRWYRDLLKRNDVTSGVAAGLSLSGIVKERFVPIVAKRSSGLAGQMIPRLVLIEMALSFLGFCDDERLSCGTLVRLGRLHLVEAPWLMVWPGAFAGLTLVALSLLGWTFAKLGRTDRYPFL